MHAAMCCLVVEWRLKLIQVLSISVASDPSLVLQGGIQAGAQALDDQGDSPSTDADEPEPGEVPSVDLNPSGRRQPIVWPTTQKSPRQVPSRQPSPLTVPLAVKGKASTPLDRSRTPTPPLAGRPGDVRLSPGDLAGVRKTAADVALEELGAFESSLGTEGVDPDAPAALKASPSGSDSGACICARSVACCCGVAGRRGSVLDPAMQAWMLAQLAG